MNLVGLMHPRMVTLAADEPLWADLTGGWIKVEGIDEVTKAIRADTSRRADVARALHKERLALPKPKDPPSLAATWVHRANLPGPHVSAAAGKLRGGRATNQRRDGGGQVPLAHPNLLRTTFPPLPSASRRNELRAKLEGAVDLERVVVVVGYGEVGFAGGARG